MPKLIKFSVALLLLFNVLSFFSLSVQADGLVPNPTATGTCPAGYGNCGNYSLNDMVYIAIVVSNFILSIVGSLALLAFIVGGLMWLLSAGNAEMVNRGKQTIIGAAVGLAIVFTSYMIIQLVFSALGITAAEGGKWATSGWTSVWPK